MAGVRPYFYGQFPLCPKCGHEVREHQPSWGAPSRSGYEGTFGCSLCNCQLTVNQKLRAWGGR